VFVGGFPIFVDGQCVGSVAPRAATARQDHRLLRAGIAAFMAGLKEIAVRTDRASSARS